MAYLDPQTDTDRYAARSSRDIHFKSFKGSKQKLMTFEPLFESFEDFFFMGMRFETLILYLRLFLLTLVKCSN